MAGQRRDLSIDEANETRGPIRMDAEATFALLYILGRQPSADIDSRFLVRDRTRVLARLMGAPRKTDDATSASVPSARESLKMALTDARLLVAFELATRSRSMAD